MDKETPNRTEALLIATVNPLTKNEISSALGIDTKVLAKALSELKKRYENTSLEVKTVGRKYKVGVRDQYSEVAFKYSESEISKGELEIIAFLFRKGRTYISHIERLRGKRAKDELDHLSKLGFVDIIPRGRMRLIKLTRSFFSRYGKELKERVKEEGKVEEKVSN